MEMYAEGVRNGKIRGTAGEGSNKTINTHCGMQTEFLFFLLRRNVT